MLVHVWVAHVSLSTALKGIIHLQRDGVYTLQDVEEQQKTDEKADEASAAAAAEELIAEEAREAAQAAAKKAKKKKAKARKQHARSDATSASASPAAAASEASAGASLQAQQDVGFKATLKQSSLSGRGREMPPDQDASGLQMQLQHMTVLDCAMPTLHDAHDKQELASASADVDDSAGNAMADDNSPASNASFLDQLFCCPITKVHAPSYPNLQSPSLGPPTLSPLVPLSCDVVIKSLISQQWV